MQDTGTLDKTMEKKQKQVNLKVNGIRKDDIQSGQPVSNDSVIIRTNNSSVYYGKFQAIKEVTMDIKKNAVTAFIGPSGCGKSTFLRLFNRMNDFIDHFKHTGDIFIEDVNIYKDKIEVEQLRKDVGMVFQKPNPFPKSIFDNVAYGLKIQGINNKKVLEERVKDALQQVGLWGEVRDDLKRNALSLSGGQQQRLCIARTLAVKPSIILMDEPTSALDPISTSRLEDLISELKKNYTILIVTHNMQQAGRISDYTAFLYMGELIEYDTTHKLFTNPSYKKTENYITGRFG
jgi:phosphate transport system ATP-binding protein